MAYGLIGGATWPLNVSAQNQNMPVIGMLGSASAEEWKPRLAAFRAGLGEVGFEEGNNVSIAYRWADGRNDRLPELAAELVALRVSVIAVIGNAPSVLAAKRATSSIPIVFRGAVDPVAAGFVPSIARPGGNITGVTTLGVELGPKQFEFMRALLPTAARFALLINPTNTVIAAVEEKSMTDLAASLGLQLHIARASTNPQIEAAFEDMSRLTVQGLIVTADSFFNSRNRLLADLSLRHRVPAITPYREFAEAGGLMSYGGNVNEGSRQAGVYVGRILKGEKPGDLPVVQPVKLELVINMKAAKILDLVFPQTILTFADDAIE